MSSVGRALLHLGVAIAALVLTVAAAIPPSRAQEQRPSQVRREWPFEVRSFAPASGPPGTRIEIGGSGFQAGDEVALGERQLPIVALGRRHIVALVPAGAQSGLLTVSRPAAG